MRHKAKHITPAVEERIKYFIRNRETFDMTTDQIARRFNVRNYLVQRLIREVKDAEKKEGS